MKRLCEILRIMFDRAFCREFIDLDMREETRMMHEEAEMAKGKIGG